MADGEQAGRAKVKAQWVDPSTGAAMAVPGSPFAGSGTASLHPATNNASGYGDWVLTLESTP